MRWFTFQEHQSSPIVEVWTAHRLIKELLLLQKAGTGRGLTLMKTQRTLRTLAPRSKRQKQTSDHVPGMFTLSTSTARLVHIYSQFRCLFLNRSIYSNLQWITCSPGHFTVLRHQNLMSDHRKSSPVFSSNSQRKKKGAEVMIHSPLRNPSLNWAKPRQEKWVVNILLEYF